MALPQTGFLQRSVAKTIRFVKPFAFVMCSVALMDLPQKLAQAICNELNFGRNFRRRALTPSVCATRLRYAPTAVLSCGKCNITLWLNQFKRITEPSAVDFFQFLSVLRCTT